VSALWDGHSISDILFSGGAIVPLLLGVALLELVIPEHKDPQPFGRRWFSNYSLMAIVVAVNTLLAPTLAFLTDIILARSPLNWAPGEFGFWIHLAYAVLVLDLLAYAVHRALHSALPLWRLHALHHSDTSLDVSTTVRHHPGEAIVTAFVLGIGGAALGCSALEVATYGVIENVVQLIGHADIRFPAWLTRANRWVLVTPQFHRIHHSSSRLETDSNYGQVFPFWDKLFGTFGGFADAARGPVEYGLRDFRDEVSQRFDQTLLLPLRVTRRD
jgi:sterol desaturase/sphingolipid hydroxylase (fatty acid hydroxylase superfamily)